MTPMLAAEANPVSILLSKPQLLFLLGAGAVWFFKTLSRAKAATAARPVTPQQTAQEGAGGLGDSAASETEDEERARQVREDILRKIEERRTPAAVRELQSMVKAAYQDRTAARPAPASAAPVRVLAPAPAVPNPITAPALEPSAGAAAPRTAGAAWLDELRSRDSARRAILVREILGPPIALR